jgi:hypothetical protein
MPAILIFHRKDAACAWQAGVRDVLSAKNIVALRVI